MLSVSTNVASLNAQRNLSNSSKLLSQSLERLSSGQRINRAADDAAGLAISEGLRSQVRGLNQAVRNANDGISLISTAEGALSQSNDILQRMRELAVQASNDTNSATNRASIQTEVDQLNSELNRIGNTVQFNGSNVLDGSFTSKLLQIGAQANQTLSVSIGDMRATSLGKVAINTSTAATAALAAGDLTLNNVAVGVTSTDSVSFNNGTFSSIAMAAAINAKFSQTGVSATVNANTETGTTAILTQTVAANGFKVNNVAINSANLTVLADDSDSTLRNAINAVSNQTGVVASLNAGNKLVLTAADGRNVSLSASLAVTTSLGLQASDSAATLEGTYTLTSDNTFTIGGAGALKAGLTAGTVNIDATTAVSTIKVDSAANAGIAIQRIDAALRQVSTQRSTLGALTNRLDSTVSNLQTVSQNLSASDSAIRDADFAAETANMTRAQILQQAGTAILAQANTTPQAALTLLK
jgi:flagellin